MQNAPSAQLAQGVSAAVAAAALICYLRDRDSTSSSLTAREIEDQVGNWCRNGHGWALFSTPALPLGPEISVREGGEFCGANELRLTRYPHDRMGKNGWATLMSFIRPQTSTFTPQGTEDTATFDPRAAWSHVPLAPLTVQEGKLCVQISRAALMTLFALTNARCIFSYSSASGYRSAFPSYSGQWAITWPIRTQCIVTFVPHESQNSLSAVYPRSFPVRASKCIEMLAGIVTDGKEWKVAFPGRAKKPGPWVLQERKRGYPGAHGSRHLYNMAGGKTVDADFLGLAPLEKIHADKQNVRLLVQCVAPDSDAAEIFVMKHEQELLARALDCLPWTHLSWSMHRGMRDILLAYGKDIMNHYREELADVMKNAVRDLDGPLAKAGWLPEFVRTSMADMASSSVMFGRGNSGDLVRIVAHLVEVLVDTSSIGGSINKDQTIFWGSPKDLQKGAALDLDGIVALTKFFVLEWSQELDYQLYHQLPTTVYLS